MIAIVNYELGNLQSVANAFEKIGAPCKITKEPDEIRQADKIILPGVGAFEHGMANLKRLGLVDVLNQEVIQNKKPFLGICLGMQLICTRSFEHGKFEGLGWIDADVVRFEVESMNLRVPHVGWNDIHCNLNSPIFAGGRQPQTVYFVHSYHVVPRENVCIAECDYGIKFCAALQKENIFATQFHPEKSQQEGFDILEKFSKITREHAQEKTNSLFIS